MQPWKCKQAREQVEKDALVKINTRFSKEVSFVYNWLYEMIYITKIALNLWWSTNSMTKVV